MKRMLLAGVAGLVCLYTASAYAADPAQTPPAAVAATPPPFFFFSSTVLEYRFEPQGTDTGFPHFFPKQIANITHVDAYQYGTNFISVDVLKSTSADPAAPATVSFTGEGSTEVFGTYRATFSGNAVTHSKRFSYGFIKDLSLEYGGDLESQNTAFAPQQTDFVVGPQLSFNVPGVLTFGALFYKEYNHNGIAQGLGLPNNPDYNAASGRVSFQPTVQFETVYLQPLTFTGQPLVFNGFTLVNLPKGLDGFGVHTRTEILTSNRLTLDLGSYVGHPKIVDVFVGYKFWYNKFGADAHYGDAAFTPGSYENQVFAGFDYHLN